MKDFLGNEIREGNWLATGGKGNGDGHYGMVLCKVLRVDDGKMQLLRLRVQYGPKRVTARKSTVTASSKFVVVEPPTRAVSLFNALVSGEANQNMHDRAAKWVGGGCL